VTNLLRYALRRLRGRELHARDGGDARRDIQRRSRLWLAFLREFFRDGNGQRPGLEPAVVAGERQIDYPAIEVGTDPETSQAIRVRVGRYGPFLQRGDGGPGNTASLPSDLPPADLTVEKAATLLNAKAAGPRLVGVDPATGLNVYATRGRYGAYVQLGETPDKATKEKPRRASLPAGLTEDAVTLEEALRLLMLPRELGKHPESGQSIVANIGRYGPYVKHGDEFRSLAEEDDVYSIDLARAVELLAAPKAPRRRRAARAVVRELGRHPESGSEIRVMEGRYGPYVTDGTVNATLPKGVDPSAVGLNEALDLLAARAARKADRPPAAKKKTDRPPAAKKKTGRKRLVSA
jgi:DNA topoisomerase I